MSGKSAVSSQQSAVSSPLTRRRFIKRGALGSAGVVLSLQGLGVFAHATTANVSSGPRIRLTCGSSYGNPARKDVGIDNQLELIICLDAETSGGTGLSALNGKAKLEWDIYVRVIAKSWDWSEISRVFTLDEMPMAECHFKVVISQGKLYTTLQSGASWQGDGSDVRAGLQCKITDGMPAAPHTDTHHNVTVTGLAAWSGFSNPITGKEWYYKVAAAALDASGIGAADKISFDLNFQFELVS